MAATASLREALNQGIASGFLIDTKIILYSHRDSAGRICRPKPLYANSHVLKGVTYFKDLLFGNFAESQSKDFKEEIDEEDSAEDYGYLSDSDLEEDEEERPSVKHSGGSETHLFDSLPAAGEYKVSYEKNEERVEEGKVVKIPDMAFVTFQAFLVYLYTDTIEFAPFGSEANRRPRSAEIADPSNDKVPRPSPKSIYRLADKYDVPALKTLALNRIRSELAKCDIVEESFSKFGSRYAEIRSLYVDQLAHVWVRDSTDAIRVKVEEKLDSFAEGDLEHAGEMLSALWKIGNKDGQVAAPLNFLPSAGQVTSPTHWPFVKTALIGSIRTGVFFDRKYWARHKRTGDVLRPVYFSSTIMGDMVHKLNKLVKYLKGRNTLDCGLKGAVNVESDCEEDFSGAKTETPEAEDKKEDETCAVLITGSFAAWKSIFFYRCTDTVSFAPLKSQGMGPRLCYIQENTVATAPPPCSPKSIYLLASLLEIQPLRDSAYADIRSKVTEGNVVGELFSGFTAVQEKIMEMECQLLISNFKNAKTIDLASENIGHISTGSSPHSIDALKLGLKKVFDLKKQLHGAKLRCSYTGCGWYSNPPSYSSLASSSGYTCSSCGNYLQCVSCANNMMSTYTACQSCLKNFILS